MGYDESLLTTTSIPSTIRCHTPPPPPPAPSSDATRLARMLLMPTPGPSASCPWQLPQEQQLHDTAWSLVHVRNLCRAFNEGPASKPLSIYKALLLCDILRLSERAA